MECNHSFLESSLNLFRIYKRMGENAMIQVPDEKLTWQYNEDSNSIATIVKHMAGNMHSRWTNFLTTDGEKEWRERDAEFANDISSREAIMEIWEKGWTVLFNAIQPLSEVDFQKPVFIRKKEHTVIDAISRQLAHYACHVGQIIYVAKMCSKKPWHSLSIPKGKSASYLQDKGSSPRPT